MGKLWKMLTGCGPGFTSVMIDGAALPFENIAFTEAVDFCKSFGVPVEAELGAILGRR